MVKFKHFLIVDDDKANNMLCKMVLKRMPDDVGIVSYDIPGLALEYIVTEYSKPENAKPTVLFLDINMPEINGWEFLEIFKDYDEEIRRQFTIYVLSSSVDSKDKNMAEQNPLVSGFISKPLTREIVKNLFLEG